MTKGNKNFRIIAITDKRTVLINAGSDDNIKVHQQFNIIDKEPVFVKDPVTDEVLDKFYHYKQKLYVTEVRKKYSICVSKYSVNQAGVSLASLVINSVPTFKANASGETKVIGQDMNVDDSEITNVLSNYTYAKVHVNDEVELISDK